MGRSISLDLDVSTQFRDLKFAFFVCETPETYTTPEEQADAQLDIVQAVKTYFQTREKLAEHPYSVAYSQFYRAMGLKPKTVSTPVQQTLRVFDTNKYKSYYKIIDIAMKIEYMTLVSFQVYDLEKIQGDMVYRFASSQDTITTFSGEEKLCKNKELVLSDDISILHSVYYGNNKYKSIDSNTKINLVRMMCVPGFPSNEFEHAKHLFSNAIPYLKAVSLDVDSASVTI